MGDYRYTANMLRRGEVQEIHADMPDDNIHMIQVMPQRTSPCINILVIVLLGFYFLKSYLEELHPGSTTQGFSTLMATMWMIFPNVVIDLPPWGSFARSIFLGETSPKFLERCTYYPGLADYRSQKEVEAGKFGAINHPHCPPGYSTRMTCFDPQRFMHWFYSESTELFTPCDSAFFPPETTYKRIANYDDPDGPLHTVRFVIGHDGPFYSPYNRGHAWFFALFVFCCWSLAVV